MQSIILLFEMKGRTAYVAILLSLMLLPSLGLGIQCHAKDTLDIWSEELRIPRNIITDNATIENTTDFEIPPELLYLLNDLERIKEIIQKYDTETASRIDLIELKILSGDTEGAYLDYLLLEKDINTLLQEIKDINYEDYLELINLLPDDPSTLFNPSQNGEGVQRLFQTEMSIDNLGLIPPLPDRSIGNDFLNPPINAPTMPSLFQMDIPIEFIIIVLLSLAAISVTIYLVVNRRNILIPALVKTEKVVKALKTKVIGPDDKPPEDPDDRIIYNYYVFLRKAAEMGYRRRRHEAPLEFVSRIDKEDISGIGERLSILFEKVRYGHKKPEKHEIEESDILVKKLFDIGSEEG